MRYFRCQRSAVPKAISRTVSVRPIRQVNAKSGQRLTDSVVVHYTNHRDQAICEYLRVGRAGANAGLFVQGSANRLEQAA
jgi:hypothetical protein